MAGFNPNYLPIRTITPPFGAIGSWNGGTTPPASWQIFNTWPPAGGDVAENGSDPFSSVFLCDEQIGNSPAAYYEDSFITNGRTPHRASGILRAATCNALCGAYSIGDVVLATGLLIVYGTRSTTDAVTVPPSILCLFDARYQASGRLRVIVAETSGTQTFLWLPPDTLTGDLFYTFGVEVFGQNIHIYFDPNGNDDPADLPGTSALEYFTTIQTSNSRGFEGPIVNIGCVVGGNLAGASNLGCAAANLVLEELEGPTGNIPPGSGGGPGPPFPPPPPPPPPFAWPKFPPFRLRQIMTDFGYWRMKSIRQLVFSMNTLRFGP